MPFQTLFCRNRHAVAYSNPFVVVLWLCCQKAMANKSKTFSHVASVWRAQVGGKECFPAFRFQSCDQRLETSARFRFDVAP
jgi:hypothetical protein